MGDGNARTGRLKLGLQIAAACVVVLIGGFAVGAAVAGPFFWYSCSLDGLEAHGAARASILVSRDGTRLGLLGASGERCRVPCSRPTRSRRWSRRSHRSRPLPSRHRSAACSLASSGTEA